MAKIASRAEVVSFITIELTESEAMALDAIVGYGADSFLKVFYKHMGESYLKPHEDGLRSLFASVRIGNQTVRHFVERAKDARDVFTGKKRAVSTEDK